MTGCFICQKHSGEVEIPGGVIYQDDLVFVSHSAIGEGEITTYLGTLFVEPRRHVPGLADLNEPEAGRIGVVLNRLSRALKESEGAEHIYLFVLGHHIPHLHVWLVPRYPGTPREYWGLRVDEWPGAPRGGPAEIAGLCERIRQHLGVTKGFIS